MSTLSRMFLGVILAFLAGSGWLLNRIVLDVEHRYRESAEELLVDTAQLVASLVAADSRGGTIKPDLLRLAMPALQRERFEARIFEAVKRDVNLRIYLTDAVGRVVYDSEGRHEGKDFSHWRDVYLTLQGQYGARSSRDPDAERPSSVMYVAAPIRDQERIIGVASVGKPTSSYLPFAEAARKNLLIGGATSGAAVILLAMAAAVWMVRPFGLVTEYLRLFRNQRGGDKPRLGRTALGILGAAYDEMRDAVSGRNYVEEYVQALTHEIKSPVSAIRAAGELLAENPAPQQRERFLKHIRDEGGRIQDIVERMLELANLEKRRELSKLERIDLAELVGETVEILSSAAAGRNVGIHADLPEFLVKGDRFLLQRALINLLSNALDFSPMGSEIEVTVTGSKRFHELTIRDQGTGIPAYAEKRVFERFYSLPRPDTGRKSTGLGLSFVREIAELHHGSVELKNHPDGGAIAVFRLPRAR